MVRTVKVGGIWSPRYVLYSTWARRDTLANRFNWGSSKLDMAYLFPLLSSFSLTTACIPTTLLVRTRGVGSKQAHTHAHMVHLYTHLNSSIYLASCPRVSTAFPCLLLTTIIISLYGLSRLTFLQLVSHSSRGGNLWIPSCYHCRCAAARPTILLTRGPYTSKP